MAPLPVGHILKIKKLDKKGKVRGPPKDLSKRLYLRMARVIKEPLDVQDLHPLIENVIMPRQRSRFCFLEFKSEDDAVTALEDLSKKNLPKGKHIVVRKATMKNQLKTEEIPFKFRIQTTGRTNMNMAKLIGTATPPEVSNDNDDSS